MPDGKAVPYIVSDPCLSLSSALAPAVHSSPVHKTKPMEPEIAGNLARIASLLARARQILEERQPMTNRYLISVAAAALIIGTGVANAQGTGTSREAPSSGAATTQQSAPSSERSPTMNRDSSQSGAPAEAPKSAQSKDMDRNG